MNILDKINNIKSEDAIDILIFEKKLRISTIFILIEMDMIIVVLNNKKLLNIRISKYPKLKNASIEQLNNWELVGGGVAIEWLDLDEDLSLKGFIQNYALQTTIKSLQKEEELMLV